MQGQRGLAEALEELPGLPGRSIWRSPWTPATTTTTIAGRQLVGATDNNKPQLSTTTTAAYLR